MSYRSETLLCVLCLCGTRAATTQASNSLYEDLLDLLFLCVRFLQGLCWVSQRVPVGPCLCVSVFSSSAPLCSNQERCLTVNTSWDTAYIFAGITSTKHCLFFTEAKQTVSKGSLA